MGICAKKIKLLILPLLNYTSSDRRKTYQNVNFLGPRKLADVEGILTADGRRCTQMLREFLTADGRRCTQISIQVLLISLENP